MPQQFLAGASPDHRRAAEEVAACVADTGEANDLSPNDRHPYPSPTPLGHAEEYESERNPPYLLPNPTRQPSLDPIPSRTLTESWTHQRRGIMSCSVQYYWKQYNKSLTEIARLNIIVIDKCTQDPIDRDDGINLTSTSLSSASFKSMIKSAIKGTTAVTHDQLLLVLDTLGLNSKGKISDDVRAERMAKGTREIMLFHFSHKTEEKRRTALDTPHGDSWS